MRWSTVRNVTQAGASRPGAATGSGELGRRQRPRVRVGLFVMFGLIVHTMLARVYQLVKFVSGSAGDRSGGKTLESERSFSQ